MAHRFNIKKAKLLDSPDRRKFLNPDSILGMVGQRLYGRLIVLDSGVLDDADTLKHVDAVSTMIARESPAWTVCDSGYGKPKNQMLMRAFPGCVWSCFSNSSSNTLPSWNVLEELNGMT